MMAFQGKMLHFNLGDHSTFRLAKTSGGGETVKENVKGQIGEMMSTNTAVNGESFGG